MRGIFAAQEIKPQARVLAEDRGITCVVVNYDELRGIDDPACASSDPLRAYCRGMSKTSVPRVSQRSISQPFSRLNVASTSSPS